MTAPQINVDTVVARWTDPSTRPKLWKGKLIGGSGTPSDPICRCAQGDVLHFAGWSDEDLRTVDQAKADAAVAKMLGLSITHSILLRNVNDQKDGCPEDVLRAPEKILGPKAQGVLAFWRHLDRMTDDDWQAFAKRRAAARAAARDAARDAAWAAAWAPAGACSEIQGADLMRERGKPFFFLPLFGFADPEAVIAAESAS